jgi:hypothetical protein
MLFRSGFLQHDAKPRPLVLGVAEVDRNIRE